MSRGYTNQGVCSFCCQADVVWIQHNLCNEPPCQVQSQRHGGLIEKLCIHFRHHLLVEVIAIWNVMYRLPTCHSCATDHPVIEHWGSLPIQSAILAMHFHPKLRQEAENCLLFIFRVPKCHQGRNFDCFRTMRVGEASNPGPNDHSRRKRSVTATIAILNPTAIRNKHEEFRVLMKTHAVDTFCCAETTATKDIQKTMAAKLRSLQLKSVWSEPVEPQKQKICDQPSLRGRAGGTSVHSKWPIRAAKSQDLKPKADADRLVHAVIQWGMMYVQIIVIYGYTGGNAWHRQATNTLFAHAIQMANTINLPTIFLGDLICSQLCMPKDFFLFR